MGKLKLNKEKLRIIFISSGSTLVIIALLIFINNRILNQKFFHFNNTWAPKNTVMRVNSEFDDMLFSMEEKLYFNVSGDKIVIYMEHYKKDSLVKTQDLITTSSNSNRIKGSIMWGIEDFNENAEIKLSVKKDELITKSSYRLKSEVRNGGAASELNSEKVKLVKNIPISLATFGYGKDSASSLTIEDGKVMKEI